MRPILLLCSATLFLVATAADAQTNSLPACSHRRLDFVESCLGHVLVRAGDERADVWLDGEMIGSTPLLISADADRSHTIEVRSSSGRTVRRTRSFARGRLALFDVAARRRATMRGLTWARFAEFDRCDGYSLSSAPLVRPMSASEFAAFARRR